MATKPKGLKKRARARSGEVRHLARDVREDLMYTAGLNGLDDPRAQEFLAAIEVPLSIAAELRRDQIEGPGPAGQAVLYRAVEEAARALDEALAALDDNTLAWRTLRVYAPGREPQPLRERVGRPHDPSEWLLDVRNLRELCRIAALRRQEQEARPGGRRPESDRDWAIEELAEAFYCRADPSIDDTYRTSLLEFVDTALRGAGLPRLSPIKLWLKIPGRFRRRATSSSAAASTASPNRRRKAGAARVRRRAANRP